MLRVLPHPNLLKVIHSYLWFFMVLINIVIYLFYFELTFSLSILICSFLFVMAFISSIQQKFLKTEYVFTYQNRKSMLNQFFICLEDIKFTNNFLERAYGLYHLKMGKICLLGIDEVDRKRIEKWSKNIVD